MDEIAKAYSLLSSMKQNVPDTFAVDQSWVNDFHSALEMVEQAINLDLQDFRVPQADLRREKSGGTI